jgi:hypothetical protein
LTLPHSNPKYVTQPNRSNSSGLFRDDGSELAAVVREVAKELDSNIRNALAGRSLPATTNISHLHL